jgi:hypothetical protein
MPLGGAALSALRFKRSKVMALAAAVRAQRPLPSLLFPLIRPL